MPQNTGQDNETARVTVKEAARKLGATEAAKIKRIQRGTLEKEPGSDRRVYVYLDLTQDMSHPKSQAHRDPLVEQLVEEMRDRVAFLERALDRRGVEAERYQQIVAGLTQTSNRLATQLRELEIAQEPPGGPRSAVEGPDRAVRRLCALRLLRFTGNGSLALLAATVVVYALIEAAEPRPRGLLSRLLSD